MNGLLKKIGDDLYSQAEKLEPFTAKLTALPKEMSEKAQRIIKEPLSFVFSKPSSLKDYVRISDLYVSKRLIAQIIAVVILLTVAAKRYLLPYLEGRLWIPTIVVNTPKYHTYSGKAKVVSEDGAVIYKGNLDGGDVTGIGELFNSERTAYEGGFLKNKFSGDGKLYYAKGSLQYQGVFENGSYKEGRLYFESGELCFDGVFDEDDKYKRGKLYFQNGNLRYEGDFEDGRYDNGTLYFEDGSIKYEGSFLNGMYNGFGKSYRNSMLLYEGEFVNNLYNGMGKIFDGGRVLYDGSFKDNVYNGYGKLYKPYTDKLLYEGDFANGQYSGYGTLYFRDGDRVLYKGEFFEGLYSGEGVLCNIQGREIYTGTFYKGEIDYIPFVDKDIETVRNAFGEERKLTMLENSFLLVYDDMKLMFEFSFKDEDDAPKVQKIKLLGGQRFLDIRNGISAEAFKVNLEADVFTEYYFELNEEDEIPFNFVNSALKEDDTAYCIKYNLETVYVRAFFEDEEGGIIYFEIGGI